MAAKTTEEVLSGLGHSTQPTIELLDDAAKVIGLHFEPSTKAYVPVSNTASKSDVAAFREQWVLKWILKKVTEDISATSNSTKGILVSEEKFWSLLNHVIQVIPLHALQEILLERNFCKTLGTSLALVKQLLEAIPTQRSPSHDSQSFDALEDRPTKRQKLSSETTSDSRWDLIGKVSLITSRVAKILSSKTNTVVDASPSSARWAKSLEDATQFLAQILEFSLFALKKISHDPTNVPSLRKDILATTHRWLSLWSSYTITIGKLSKQKPCLLFNEHVLVLLLSLRQLNLESENGALFQLMERLVALNTIIPARDAFQQHVAHVHKARTEESLSRQVKLVAFEIAKPWGASIHELDSDLCSQLISIASRLVPRADISRRKSEAPWLEALFYTLTGVGPHSTNGDVTLRKVSSGLLRAFEETEVEPTSDFWRQYIHEAVLSTDVEWRSLARIVKLNTSIFVPGLNKEGNQLLETIGRRLPKSNIINKEEKNTIVRDILEPIIEISGKRRQLPAYVDFWQKILSDTLRDDIRLSTGEPGSMPASQIWYDPELLQIFESTVRSDPPLALFKTLLGQVEQDLDSMPSEAIPASEVFARILIISTMIRPLSISSVSFNPTTVRISICKVLQQDEDYHGQIWLLWRLLDFLTSVQVEGADLEELRDYELPWLFSDTIQPPKMPHPHEELMQRYHRFCLVATLYRIDHVAYNELFNQSLASLNNLLSLCLRNQASEMGSTASWNGSVGDMTSAEKFLSACINRLAAMPMSWIQRPKHYELLVNFLDLASCFRVEEAEGTDTSCTLSKAAESLLTGIYVATNEDILDLFLTLTTKEDSGRLPHHVPGLVHRCIRQHMNRGQAQKLSDVILKGLNSNQIQNEAIFIDYLGVLGEIASSYPKVIGKHWSELTAALQRPITSITATEIAIAFGIIEKVVVAVITWNLSRESGQQMPALSTVLDWAKARIKEAKSPQKNEFFQSYDSFVLLANVRLTKSIRSSDLDSKLKKTSTKLEAGFQKIGFKIVRQLLQGSTDPKACLLAWKVVETLEIFETNEHLQSEVASNRLKLTSQLHKCRAACIDQSKCVQSKTSLLKSEVDYLAAIATDAEKAKLSAGSLDELGAAIASNELVVHGVPETGEDLSEQSAKFVRGSVLKMLSPTAEESYASKEIAPYLSLARSLRSLTLETGLMRTELIERLGELAYLQAALKETNPVALIMQLEISKIILERHPGIMNQHIVDNTLKAVALLASSASTLTLDDTPNNPQPNHIFDRLCTILTTLLIRYRRRIPGRYSLLLPALQSLLKCLFCPPTRAHLNTTPTTYPSKAAFLDSLPHWLNPRTHTSPATLPPTSATIFSRLLQTLCEPSVSAARRTLKRPSTSGSSHRNPNPSLNLVDDTKRLRRQVARHMQYFLQTFCQTVLDGYIAPEARERLLPGLFAVLAATEIEVMRGLNAGMDESQRAIWRDLYAEWKGGTELGG